MIVFVQLTAKKAKLAIVFAFFAFTQSSAQALIPISAANSPFDEMHPALSPEGDLYFTRAFHPENTAGSANLGDIWMSKALPSGEYQTAIRVADLSSDGLDVVLGFSGEDRLYVYHSIHHQSQGIYRYRRSEGGWVDGEKLEIPGFRPTGPQVSGRLSKDSNTIVLSMASFDAYGNEDLYITRKSENGAWSRLLHLGPEINTTYQELTPFLSADEQVLYFSSNGHGDQSLQKIYFSLRLDDSFLRWTTPLPVSILQTFGITLSFFTDFRQDKTYLTSTTSSEGYGDIFLIGDGLIPSLQSELQASQRLAAVERVENIPEPEQEVPLAKDLLVKNIPRDSVIMEPLEAAEEDTQVKVSWKDRLTERYSDFQLILLENDGIHTLSSESAEEAFERDLSHAVLVVAGYLPVNLRGTGTDWEIPALIPARPGERLTLDNIRFQRGDIQFLDADSAGELRMLALFLDQNPTLKISLEGHTDSYGNVELNKKLSLDRANAIREHLVSQGIAFERIRVSGFGGSRPVADNQSEAGRILNRRVEMVILEE
ncbi:MAG: OmpA family protein [Lunatimonas sp.]|uniref:OmpA family protein n=1 Tax=Lunatimonas sp. TaxID=2060141 RepID=UPI00263B12B3|nr:OmpA family protein [Lunatimonas sp.]MCC5938814.1 OmpA family protein [Lunatimonas sp.]